MRTTRTSRPLRRSLATILAVLLVFALGGQATGLRPCPHHSRGAFGSDRAESGPSAPAPTRGTAAHSGDEAPGTDAGEAPHRPCTCFGTCHTGATAVVPTTTDLPLPTVPGARTGTIAPTSLFLPPVREPGFLLHLPNAPPA